VGSPNGKITPAVLLSLMAKQALPYKILEMPKGCVSFAS